MVTALICPTSYALIFSPFPGGFGITPGRHYDRSARNSLDWDRKERVTPAEQRTVFRTIGIVRPDHVPGSA